MAKLSYKLIGMLASMIAGRIFRRAWTLIRPQDDTPKATDAWRGWGEVLLAAVLQGAIFALVKGRCRPQGRGGHAQAHRSLARR